MPFVFAPHGIDDRSYWSSVVSSPALRQLWQAVDSKIKQIPSRLPMPTAAEYLAAKRHNDRGILDRHWRNTRPNLAILFLDALRRGEGDDRLLNWIFDYTFEPSWTVAAHLPGNDLPQSNQAQLDLAGSEMAGELAELVEVLKPWLQAQSPSFAKTILGEIDRRCLTPFLNTTPWWANPNEKIINNWSGVCAGGLLMACMAMERIGEPRPEAKKRAIDALNLFWARGFTKSGECDEGPVYWQYGVEYACMPLERMTREEIAANFDAARIKAVAGYLERCHVYGNYFLATNDSVSRLFPSNCFVPWLAEFADSDFLRWWSGSFGQSPSRAINGVLREVDLLPRLAKAGELKTPKAKPYRLLPDQQVAIFQRPAKSGLFTFSLTGGTNNESHNHNDLGSFQVIINDVPWLLDLGMPDYTSDFFGPQRYTKYVVAMSSGHCCPAVNGFEQKASESAAAKVVDENVAAGQFAVDLSTSYPHEAGLTKWLRSARVANAGAEVALVDNFVLRADGVFTHRVWFREKPAVSGSVITCGPLALRLSDAPDATRIVEFTAGMPGLALREFPADHKLFRVELDYRCKAGQSREITTTIHCA